MKKLFILIMLVSVNSITMAQQYVESFDANSLEWTECAYKNGIGTAIIDGGALTIKSKGELKGVGALLSAASGVATKVRENTFFESHCYAPIDVEKPFTIISNVNVKQLAEDRLVGLVFNYRDDGNFYCFSFNDDFIKFIRYVDGNIVGSVMQGIKWSGKRKSNMQWVLVSDGQQLTFKVDGASIMTIRYMPLSYTGFGYYTYGNQELVVDDVKFIQ